MNYFNKLLVSLDLKEIYICQCIKLLFVWEPQSYHDLQLETSKIEETKDWFNLNLEKIWKLLNFEDPNRNLTLQVKDKEESTMY